MGFAQGSVIDRADYIPEMVGFIEYLFVVERFRRMGIGTGLVRRLCEFFVAEGVQEVNLRYILGNREVEAFWRSLRFKPMIETASTRLDLLIEFLQK